MHLTQNWEVRKPGAASRGGIVAAQSATAAKVGAEVLAAGGTAVDAAVATALALAAVEPWNSGLGGIGFMVVQQAGAERAEVVDFGPVAPRALDPAAFPLTGKTRTELFTWPQVVDDRNIHGPLAFVTPSAVRGYAVVLERFGRMPWRELLAPAIRLARSGLPVDWFTTVKVASAAADLRRYEESRRVWLPDGLPPVCPLDADALSLPLGRLAQTLERLAEAGPDDFYRGDIARSIAADTRAAEGVLSAEDLAQCRARFVPALDIPYRGTTFQAAPGMTAGPTLARVLGQLEKHSFAGSPDAAYFEAVIEALRIAYSERLARMGDAETGLSTSTTHITAVDRRGGIAALTTTLLSSFGSRFVLPGTGILMNNGVMWFDPQPGRPNSIGPAKRALTNMCPIVVAREGQPWFAAGASGGRRILGAVVQMASFVIDFGMDPEVAAHHPRVDVNGGNRIGIDRRLPAGINERLSAQPGTTLVEHTVFPARFACPNLVLRGADGVNHGISDVMSPWSAAAAEPDSRSRI
jgi:gamma-glutamyltranspeptidase/glutathione hydrolase